MRLRAGKDRLCMLWGCLIPILNSTFIQLSTTGSLFYTLFPRLIQDWTSCTILQEIPKSKLVQRPCPIYRKIKLPCRATTVWPTPPMVMGRCSNLSTLDCWYSQVLRNEVPLSRCGLNGPRSAERVTLPITRQFVAVRSWPGSTLDLTYIASSWRCITEVILVECFWYSWNKWND